MTTNLMFMLAGFLFGMLGIGGTFAAIFLNARDRIVIGWLVVTGGGFLVACVAALAELR